MTVLKNNNVLTFLILPFYLLSCSNKNKTNEGFLKSLVYEKDLDNHNDYRYNFDYSTKRLFMLLGEEGFLYSSNYDFYAVYFYSDDDLSDFFIIKSKDSIISAAHKRLDSTQALYYVDKLSESKLDRKEYVIKVKTKVLDAKILTSAASIVRKAKSLVSVDLKYHPPYHSPNRCLYLLFDNQYSVFNDFNLPGQNIDEIDSFFRRSVSFP